MTSVKDYLELHKQFEFSYFLIGLLEVSLRKQIPVALTKKFIGSDRLKWHSGLQLNEQGQKSLKYALKMNRESPENYLPLSFWRFLLSKRNYGPLWLPSLHTVFPGISLPKRIDSFKTVDKNMDTALRLRNNVAHFNLDSVRHMPFSQEKTKWLLINLGIDHQLLVQSGQFYRKMT
ncbi:MAG: hypothetical protein HW379_717 [Actinobacteria bacterium]|jgi:hypothetical protein|nr:hypothetical protein [Actinomycetota bacterium]